MLPVQATRTFAILAAATLIGCVGGCTRAHFFKRANIEATRLVAEKARDPRWSLHDFRITPDERSRYFDIYSEIRPPAPLDDPSSHEFMHSVDGRRGFHHWDADGRREHLENPMWYERLCDYCPRTDDGAYILSLPSSVLIASVNSPEVQRQLETVYLSALDVSAERFEFDVQFFGGNDTTWAHFGRLRDPNLGERNELTTDTDALIRRRFATAGELLVGFANTFVWQFAGPNTNTTFSLLNFTFVQPLLRGAFRDIALEDLTQAERDLLANVRAFERYRQGFFTNLTVGQLGVIGPIRSRSGASPFPDDVETSIRLETVVNQVEQQSVISPNRALTTGFVTSVGARLGGFLGLLQQLQELRNSEQNLMSQERVVQLLESHLTAGTIELIQVDEFRQTVEVERNNVIEQRTRLENELDDFKVTKLGIPSQIPVKLDDDILTPIQFNDAETIQFQQDVERLRNASRDLVEQIDIENDANQTLQSNLSEAVLRATDIHRRLVEMDHRATIRLPQTDGTPEHPGTMVGASGSSTAVDLDNVGNRIERLRARFESDTPDILQPKEFAAMTLELSEIADQLFLIEIRIRVRVVALPTLTLAADEALRIAHSNRLDWMNARASLVDQWRQIRLQANSLESDLDVFASGDVGTTGNNPVRFRGPTGTLRLGLRFDGAFTRLIERNSYRESIIEYERARRDLIQFQDTVAQNLRRLIREMKQLEASFTIQRRAIEIAVRRVDVTLRLMQRPPVPAPTGGPTNQLSPTTSFNMLTALSDLRSSKDNLLSVWLNYRAAEILLARDLGVLRMDPNGIWLAPLEEQLAFATRCPPPHELPPAEVLMEESPPLPMPATEELSSEAISE